MKLLVAPAGLTAGFIAACVLRFRIAGDLAAGLSVQVMLAVGRQQYPLYHELLAMFSRGWVQLKNVLWALQDDWVLDPTHPKSLQATAKRMFLDPLGVQRGQCLFPSGDNIDQYPELLAARGPVKVLVLGIGPEAHFAFVKKGAEGCLGRPKKFHVSQASRESNAEFFGNDWRNAPEEAVSIRFQTVQDAEHVILICASMEYAEWTDAALFGEITPECPCSLLRTLPPGQVTVVFSPEMATFLRGRGRDIPDQAVSADMILLGLE